MNWNYSEPTDWSFFSGCNDYKGRTNTLEPSTTQLKQWGPNLSIRNEMCRIQVQKDPITSIQVTKEYCNYLNFNCRVSSWTILIHFQCSTNMQRPVQLFQPKHAQSKQTPTISNKAYRFQAKSSIFLRTMCIGSGLLNFFQLKSPKSGSKCDHFKGNTCIPRKA